MTLELVEHKEIDSIIDEAKASGLYNIDKINIEKQNDENFFNDSDDWSDSNESLCNEPETKRLMTSRESPPKLQQQYALQTELNSLPRSDSDVTIIRVKKQRTKQKKQANNKWESIHDKAVPGDGTHLAESPSLVNLATFVNSDNIQKEAGEYLVPISSWDPTHKEKRNPKNLMIGISDTHFEDFKHSLHIPGKSDSRANILFMMKQKLTPRPGALFSQNPTTKNIESDNFQLDNNNQEFSTIKGPRPPCENYQRRTIKRRLHSIARKVLCACCVFEPVNRKTRDTFEIGVQTMNNELDL